MSDAELSFATDIKPLFREFDRISMERAFDLWDYEAVVTHREAIVERLSDGSMPCDEPWPTEQVDVVRNWIAQGYRP